MTRQQIITHISTTTGLTRQQARAALEAFLAITATTLEQGERIVLHHFGTFVVRSYPARERFNPLTGEMIEVPPVKRVQFRASARLQERINTTTEHE